jgi:hypothetical protein
MQIITVKTIITGALLSAILILTGCSKSGNSDQPTKRDTTFEFLLTSVNFYDDNGILVKDTFEFDQNGMINSANYFSKGSPSPTANYGVTFDGQLERISAFDYSTHDGAGDQYTKFDVGYNGQGKVSSMIPKAGGSLTSEDYQVLFSYGQNTILYNAFGASNEIDTLVYTNGNLVHRQHYGSNTAPHVSSSTTMDYSYSSYANPFNNKSLINMAGLFMKCPTNGAGREYDYLADVLSTNLPDNIYYVFGPPQQPNQWGNHVYTWKTDTSGRVVSGDLVFNDSVWSSPGPIKMPYIVHYRFDFTYKQTMVIR